MELKKINSLVELFFKKYEEKDTEQNQPFLKWLKDEKKNVLTWKQVQNNIVILSKYLRKILSKGDRCVLLSENRPEWFIADIAIMNAGGVTVPLFTTYSERDNDLEINVLKGKKLTNVRASGSDTAVILTPPRKMSLEQMMSYINDDENLEVTPKNLRLRKKYLDPHVRKRMLKNSEEKI